MNPFNVTVAPFGPENAEICMIGEAPWKEEISHWPPRPFAGWSGHKAKEMVNAAGLDWGGLRLDNVMPTVPPGYPEDTSMEAFGAERLREGIFALRKRLRSLPNVKVFVPVGNHACFALTGMGKVTSALRKLLELPAEGDVGISKLRGSVFEFNGRKVIPTLHPASLAQHGHTRYPEKACRADWLFVKREARCGFQKREIRWAVRNTRLDIGYDVPLAVDIETWSRDIDCVGFAWSEKDAVVIDTSTDDLRKRNLPLVKAACESPNPKVLQNGLWDAYWLMRRWGVRINNWQYDTLGMHHALDPVAPHSLNYLASIYTFPRLNYWKDEAKDAKDLRKFAATKEKVFEYNVKDTTATWEICKHLKRELSQEDLLDFYYFHYRDLIPHLLDMMLTGFCIDTNAQRTMADVLKTECADIRDRLAAYAGTDLYAKTDFSSAKLRRFLVDHLGMRPWFRNRKETLDANALLHMAYREPKLAGPVVGLVLRHRELAKQIQYLEHAWDWDGRIRCEYTYRTEAGRLSSRKNPMGRGFNLQNVPRDSI